MCRLFFGKEINDFYFQSGDNLKFCEYRDKWLPEHFQLLMRAVPGVAIL